MHNELVFSIDELKQVCVSCPVCQTEVILDLAQFDFEAAGRGQEANGRMVFLPPRCAACGIPYGKLLRSLNAFQEAYAGLAGLGEVLRFRIKRDSDD